MQVGGPLLLADSARPQRRSGVQYLIVIQTSTQIVSEVFLPRMLNLLSKASVRLGQHRVPLKKKRAVKVFGIPMAESGDITLVISGTTHIGIIIPITIPTLHGPMFLLATFRL